MTQIAKGRGADLRRERARATRRRIVEAAYKLMAERGYVRTTMTDIADEAGVAVQTVYFTFHTKAALLQEAFDLAVIGDDLGLGPDERPWFREFEEEPEARAAIEIAVAATAPIFERVAPLRAVFQTLADDPEAAGFHAQRETLRHDAYRRMVAMLARKRQLRPGLDLDQATDAVFVLLSPDLYRDLVVGRGWTQDAWCAWIATTLEQAIYGAVLSLSQD